LNHCTTTYQHRKFEDSRGSGFPEKFGGTNPIDIAEGLEEIDNKEETHRETPTF
jgi:hypothetical protein